MVGDVYDSGTLYTFEKVGGVYLFAKGQFLTFNAVMGAVAGTQDSNGNEALGPRRFR